MKKQHKIHVKLQNSEEYYLGLYKGKTFGVAISYYDDTHDAVFDTGNGEQGPSPLTEREEEVVLKHIRKMKSR